MTTLLDRLVAEADIAIPFNHAQADALRGLETGLMICSAIQTGMHGAIARWVVWGIRPGDFLLALLSNDLMEAIGRADDFNRVAIPEWAKLLYNWCPSGCFGDQDTVLAWRAQSGLADGGQRAILVERATAAAQVQA